MPNDQRALFGRATLTRLLVLRAIADIESSASRTTNLGEAMKTSAAEVESLMAASKRQFLAENTKPGEIYAGLLLGVDGEPDVHLLILPGEIKDVTWDKAKAWASKVGGDLPTRREQRLLFANAKAAFSGTWYWSCEQHAGYPTLAWDQNFASGYQGYNRKSYAGRARLVRRLPI